MDNQQRSNFTLLAFQEAKKAINPSNSIAKMNTFYPMHCLGIFLSFQRFINTQEPHRQIVSFFLVGATKKELFTVSIHLEISSYPNLQTRCLHHFTYMSSFV